MASLIRKDFVNERNTKIAELRKQYETELKRYYEEYTKFITNKYSGDANKRAESNTNQKNIKTINGKLNNILDALRQNNTSAEMMIKDHEANIKNKTNIIHRRNHLINRQDGKIAQGNNEMLSRSRQIEFTEERNRYRKIMIIALIIVNIFLVLGLYVLFTR